MKILLLCWRDSTHPQGGGSERYLERVAEYLVGQGHQVVYRTAAHPGAPRRSVRGGVCYMRAGGTYGVYVRAAVAMLLGRVGLGRLRGVDVVVDTQNGVPFWAGVFAGRPTILVTHHCHKEQWPVLGGVLAKVGWFLESRVSPRVHRGLTWVTVSVPSKKELVDLGVQARNVTIIRNGVDPLPQPVPILVDDGKTHLVTLSRLVPHKQIEHAIDIIARLGEDVVLDVIGSGWWEEHLREYARAQQVADRVVFHGQVTEDYKHALLERAHVHVFPSRKEGWGLAVMEAAQHAVPSVGYWSAGGVQDSIRHAETGLLASSPEELRKAVVRLLEDHQLRGRLGAAARSFAAQFSWEHTGRDFSALIEQIAPNTVPGSRRSSHQG